MVSSAEYLASEVDLPGGTVTFLFTDIEGSTRLLKKLRDRYDEALAEHHRILRAAFAEHGGREINTAGDSFFAAFGRARDGIAAAIDAQRVLAEHTWPDGAELRVRMGLHSGEPLLGRDRYVGVGVHRAARISAAGHGGQVLVSQATRELMRDAPLPEVSFVDLGVHELKDLDEAERIYQIAAPGLAEHFPPLVVRSATPLPTGVLTFLVFTLEGPTGLWDSQPEAMAAALVHLDGLIVGFVEPEGRRLLQGDPDTTVTVFESATAAVRAATAAIAGLAAITWPDGSPLTVRLGLHSGEAQLHDDRYAGSTINLATRLCEIADDGEVLLSETAAALVNSNLPAGYAVVDLGTYRLRGITRPESVKALTGPGLATPQMAAECPYRGLVAFEPDDRHLFFGREQVVSELLARIADSHLLAIIGPSGNGKSSLLRAGVCAAVIAGELEPLRSVRLVTPGNDPPLQLGQDPSELLIVDQFEEIYTQCHDEELRGAFTKALLSRPGPVVIGVRADFYGELAADAELAAAVARNQVLLGPMKDDDLRRAIAEPARLAGLHLEHGFIDLVLRDVAREPGALPLMSHALRQTWTHRDGRTLTVEGYRECGGVASAVARTADAVLAATPEADRILLRNVFLRLTELGEVEDTRRRVQIEELLLQGTSQETLRALLDRLAEARLVTLDEGTAEVAHEALIRSWPTLRGWLEEDREGIRLHRRLGDAARLWDSTGRQTADLYRGTRLDGAADWAESNPDQLNATEREFLNASTEDAARVLRRQQESNRRLRRALVTAGVLLVASLALAAFAAISRRDAVGARADAVRTEAIARSRALASESESQLGRDPQRALLLSRAALASAATPEAELAGSEALDANTVRAQLPSFGVQTCANANYMYLLGGGRVAVDNDCTGHVVFANLDTRRIVRRVRVGPASTSMVPAPSRQALLVATGRDVVSVDVRSGAVHHVFTAPFPIAYMTAGPPGNRLALTDGVTVGVLDLASGTYRTVARADANTNGIIDLGWASRTELLVEASGQSKGNGTLPAGLSTLDVDTGAARGLQLPMPAYHVVAPSFMNIAPDLRTWFITGAAVNAQNGSKMAATWAVDARSRRLRWVAFGPAGGEAASVQPSSDSRLVGVGYSTGAVDVLDATTGRQLVREPGSSSILAGWMAFPPKDNSLVTVTLDGVFRIWATQGSERLRLQAPPSPAVDFTPDGRSVVLVGVRGEDVDLATGRTVRTFPGFPSDTVFNACSSACFATSSGLRYLTFLDPASATPRIVELDETSGRRVATVTVPRVDAQGVAPDGRIVTAYHQGNRVLAQLIDPRTGSRRALQPGLSDYGCGVSTPSFTPDSRLMAVVDGCVRVDIWNLGSGKVVKTLVLPDRANASSNANGGTSASGAHLTPDGRYVLVAVEGGGFVRVDIATGAYAELPGAQTVANALAISPDGRWYAIGRADGTVDVYDARSLALVRHHTLVSPIQTLAFSPSGGELAVVDAGNVLWVWDTCAICENAHALAQAAAHASVRTLTRAEQATFHVNR